MPRFLLTFLSVCAACTGLIGPLTISIGHAQEQPRSITKTAGAQNHMGTTGPDADTPSGGTAAESAATAPEAPPATTTVSCFPQCRTGYFCHESRCISKCNPRCSAGETCSDNGECTTQPTASPVVLPPIEPAPTKAVPQKTESDLRVEKRVAIQRERAKISKERRILFTKPRIPLVFGLSVFGQESPYYYTYETPQPGSDDYSSSYAQGYFSVASGYQRNFSGFMGVRILGEIGVGKLLMESGLDSMMFTAGAEVFGFFGPLNRFYIGPVLWANNYWTGGNHYPKQKDNPMENSSIDSYGLVGGGMEMGVILGEEGKTYISWKIKNGFIEPISISAHIAFTYFFIPNSQTK